MALFDDEKGHLRNTFMENFRTASINRDGKKWKLEIPRIIKGTLGTIQGSDPNNDVVITISKFNFNEFI